MPLDPYPNIIENGDPPDADLVMEDFDHVRDFLNGGLEPSDLAAGNPRDFIVCDATGVPQYVGISGDIEIDEDGVATIAPQTIDPSQIGTMPAVGLVKGNQTITSGTGDAIIFTQEDFDTDTLHDNSVNPTRITFTTAGVYVITARVQFIANDTGRRTASLTHSTDGVLASSSDHEPSGGASSDHSLAAVHKVTAGSYVTLAASQTSGGDLGVAARFAAAWVSKG